MIRGKKEPVETDPVREVVREHHVSQSVAMKYVEDRMVYEVIFSRCRKSRLLDGWDLRMLANFADSLYDRCEMLLGCFGDYDSRSKGRKEQRVQRIYSDRDPTDDRKYEGALEFACWKIDPMLLLTGFLKKAEEIHADILNTHQIEKVLRQMEEKFLTPEPGKAKMSLRAALDKVSKSKRPADAIADQDPFPELLEKRSLRAIPKFEAKLHPKMPRSKAADLKQPRNRCLKNLF